MKMDGVDKAQIAQFAGEPVPGLKGDDDAGGGPPAQPDMTKYDRMKAAGMPELTIRNKMTVDLVDEYWIREFFGEDHPKPGVGAGGRPMEPPGPKPDMNKYAKMKKIGMPEASVRNKMRMDQVDPYWIRDYFGEPQPLVGGGGGRPMSPPGDKPNMNKYEKMKKIGMPEASVRNKMRMDGIDAYWIRDYFGEPQPIVGGGGGGKVMEPPSAKPDFAKYEKMKKVGLPVVSIKNKMKKDGIHEYWQRDFFGEPQPIEGAEKKKKKLRRPVKPLHWRKKSECDWNNTLWGNLDGLIDLDKFAMTVDIGDVEVEAPESVKLKPITTESLIDPEMAMTLEKVFTNYKKPKVKKAGTTKKEDKKEEVSLLDPKRAFNMIVGLRQFEKMDIDDIKIRNFLLRLDESRINMEMLESLSKFVPNNDELNELKNYDGDRSVLARGDQFVMTMTKMVDIKERVDVWRFKMGFKERVFEVEKRIDLIRTTLDALKTDPTIAAFMKICLIIGNFMNESTNRGDAKGIKLESVERIASMKSADNKQTMLMFIMKYIEKHYGQSDLFRNFPQNVNKMVEIAKKIEAKTIRDGIGDMKDSLQRIGKKITRVSRDMQAVEASFYASAGNVLKVLTKMKKRTAKLGLTPKAAKSKKSVTFKEDEDESKEDKPRRFRIVEEQYTGSGGRVLRRADTTTSTRRSLTSFQRGT